MFTRFTCFDIRTYSLHYNVLSGLIIISFSRSKRVNGKIICLCTRSEKNLFSCKMSKSSTTAVIELRFFTKKKKMKMKNLHFISHVIFSSNFLHAVTFYKFSTLTSLEDRLRLKLKTKTNMYGCNAGPPMAIPIYTVLPYCVIWKTSFHAKFQVHCSCGLPVMT